MASLVLSPGAHTKEESEPKVIGIVATTVPVSCVHLARFMEDTAMPLPAALLTVTVHRLARFSSPRPVKNSQVVLPPAASCEIGLKGSPAPPPGEPPGNGMMGSPVATDPEAAMTILERQA